MSLIDAGEVGRNTPARYNIAPTQNVLFAASDDGQTTINEGMWWLVPFWAKERPKYPTFNARSETAAKKPSFRESFKNRRCLIFADGYYEWTNADDGGKNPHYITLPDQRPFVFAGLWAYNTTLDLISCTILTAPAADEIKHLHERMPIIVEDSAWENWLDDATTVEQAQNLLKANRGAELVSYRVRRDVNNSSAKGAELIEPID